MKKSSLTARIGTRRFLILLMLPLAACAPLPRADVSPGARLPARADVTPGAGLPARADISPGAGPPPRADVTPGAGLPARADVSPGAGLPARADVPLEWRPSPNFDDRRPNYVIIHATSDDTADDALRTLTDPQRKVSSHYLIGRDGTVYQLVDERARAWHAGESQWGADTDINSGSLGIELDNNGREPFSNVQISALLSLLGSIAERYRIPAANYLGHGDVAPRRKVDPSAYFPWSILARQGYGLWCDSPLPEPPPAIDAKVALRAIGYDTADLDAALLAFKRHFVQDETTAELTDRVRGMLYCVLSKSMGPGRGD